MSSLGPPDDGPSNDGRIWKDKAFGRSRDFVFGDRPFALEYMRRPLLEATFSKVLRRAAAESASVNSPQEQFETSTEHAPDIPFLDHPDQTEGDGSSATEDGRLS